MYINENTHFSFSNLHSVLFNSRQIFCIPESPSLFPLRSSSLRFEGLELNAEVRAAQPSAVILLLFNLQRQKQKQKTKRLETFFKLFHSQLITKEG